VANASAAASAIQIAVGITFSIRSITLGDELGRGVVDAVVVLLPEPWWKRFARVAEVLSGTVPISEFSAARLAADPPVPVPSPTAEPTTGETPVTTTPVLAPLLRPEPFRADADEEYVCVWITGFGDGPVVVGCVTGVVTTGAGVTVGVVDWLGSGVNVAVPAGGCWLTWQPVLHRPAPLSPPEFPLPCPLPPRFELLEP
jgi:hypothetical protein